jgi:hypothetical protein
MSKLAWDTVGERYYELGVSKGVLFPYDKAKKTYSKGVAWNGLTGVSENPDGADLTDLWADNIKYASLRATENFKATIEAYTYPKEFEQCDGSAEIADGVNIGQQTRCPFGFTYVTKIGNDVDDELGYKLHIVYNATASPSDKSYETVNDSPDAITFSWEIETNPVDVTGYKPTSFITIDSTKADATKLKALEDKLYGTESEEPSLPTPDEIVAIMKANG